MDAVFATPAQTRQHFLLALAVPHLDGVAEETCLDPFADQARRHRVNVPLDGDRAARLHAHVQPAERFQTSRRQRL